MENTIIILSAVALISLLIFFSLCLKQTSLFTPFAKKEVHKRHFCFLVSSCIALFCLPVINKIDAIAADDGYTITSYDMDITVNENNILDITENIQVYYKDYRHGIIRSIPLQNKVVRTDGSYTITHTKVSSISCDEPYTTSISGNHLSIKIGDESKTITGEHSYTLHYSYDLGADPLKYQDEFYFNIIGDQWDTTIEQVTFTIHMPKKFDKSNLGFSSGKLGTIGTDHAFYSVNDTEICGTYPQPLSPGEAFTVRLTLPEGYFVRETTPLEYLLKYLPLLCIFLTVCGFLLWFFKGRNEKLTAPMLPYPPEGLNSAEISYIYYGSPTTRGSVSLLFYLASKGYLKLCEESHTFLGKKLTSFRIELLKSYDGNNGLLQTFYEGLKLCSRQSKIVYSKDLQMNFYKYIKQIKKQMNDKDYTYTYFLPGYTIYRAILGVFIFIIYLLITINVIGTGSYLIFALFIPCIGLFMASQTLFSEKLSFSNVFSFLWGLVFLGILWKFLVGNALFANPACIFSYLLGIVCIVILTYLLLHTKKRTRKGQALYGQIVGFRRFLMTAQESYLQDLLSENPDYFSDMLPYAYALNISDEWAHKFEYILTSEPVYYESSRDIFCCDDFTHGLSCVINQITASADSTGGSDGDGGSSGGGNGGGGGSSW